MGAPLRYPPQPPPTEPVIDHDQKQSLSARGVTIVVPAYNEQDGIEGVIERLDALALAVPVEILVVDDGSTDGTALVLERLRPRFPQLRIEKHLVNRGYGAALKTGFARARHDVVVITDGDGTYPEKKIEELLAHIDDGADMAVGSRTGADVHVPFARRPAKAVLRRLASFLTGTPIPDLNSGLRAIRRSLVLMYRPILPSGFSFTTTITLAALTNDHRVDYVPITYAKREGLSKIRPIRDTLAFTALILRTVMYFNPLKVFVPIAVLVGLGLGVSLYFDCFETSPANLSDKTTILFFAFLQLLAVGTLADLVEKRSRL